MRNKTVRLVLAVIWLCTITAASNGGNLFLFSDTGDQDKSMLKLQKECPIQTYNNEGCWMGSCTTTACQNCFNNSCWGGGMGDAITSQQATEYQKELKISEGYAEKCPDTQLNQCKKKLKKDSSLQSKYNECTTRAINSINTVSFVASANQSLGVFKACMSGKKGAMKSPCTAECLVRQYAISNEGSWNTFLNNGQKDY